MEKLPDNENLETVFEHLERFFRTETVIGEPIEAGDATLIPLITVTFGCGTGSGGGKGKVGSDNVGGALGVGAKISADAILVIRNNTVTMLPVKGQCNMDKLIAAVPELLKKIQFKKGNKEE